jgi:mono/diheme cytochrome c family protein
VNGKGIALQKFQGISPAVKQGTALMASLPQLGDGQIGLIENYLGTLSLPADGAHLYSRFCAQCHGTDANGRTGKGIPLQRFPCISPTVKNGSGTMTRVSLINDAQITLVENYLATLTLPTDGTHLYWRFCATCHGNSAEGVTGKGIPLQKYQGIATPVKNGTALMAAVPVINDAQISTIEQYLSTFQFPTEAQKLYWRFCASCHGTDASGRIGRGIALQQFSPISDAVKSGTSLMPAVGQINDAQISLVEGYLGTLPLPTTGGGLYSRFCAQCHGTDAGGVSGKGIALQQYSPIFSAVKNGSITMPPITKLNDQQISLVESYLATVPLPTTGSGLYSRFCASCHGTDAAGITGKGIALMKYTGISPTVKNGTADMAAVGLINDGQIALVEQYLGTLTLPSDGKILYSRFCQSCHASDASGKVARSAIAIQQWSPISTVVKNGTYAMPAIAGISNGQITLVEQYLATIPLPTTGVGLNSRFCASCHGLDALGRDTVMLIAGASNIWIPVHNGNASLNSSKYKMAAQTAVTQTQSNAIETYLGTVAWARSGRNIYFRYCLMCHGPRGSNLGDGRNSVSELRSKVRSGSTNGDNGMPKMPAYTTSQIADNEMQGLFNYIITLH